MEGMLPANVPVKVANIVVQEVDSCDRNEDTGGDEDALVGSESIKFSTDFNASGTLFSLEVMIIRISVRTEDINLIPVVPKRLKHEGSTDRVFLK